MWLGFFISLGGLITILVVTGDVMVAGGVPFQVGMMDEMDDGVVRLAVVGFSVANIVGGLRFPDTFLGFFICLGGGITILVVFADVMVAGGAIGGVGMDDGVVRFAVVGFGIANIVGGLRLMKSKD